ncbi:restriction endonuclease subunit S [Amycolatopsis thermalba]|uniref:Restriction endonuclease subunit S n=1 Tax=Amycolatopsis thermalba TaxID=944492 RepID=A0ABY4P1H1_9PSEU|nr:MULTISPECIES: restriction endonuclease subunit S [Amycolatopsis]UQS26068.1 restriction endonuclease subunit S [Amycolatopsis thermalba]
MNGELVKLGDLIEPAPVELAGQSSHPVLSMTMHRGLVEQGDKFKKRVASADTSSYKVVRRGQLVVGFPIDEGVLSFQTLYPAAIVSPAYGIWNLKSDNICRRYLERYLRSPRALAYYSSKLRGTTARRRSLPQDVFKKLPVPIFPFEKQEYVADILDAMDELRAKRREALGLLDDLSEAIFIAMFGNPVANEKGWPIGRIGDIIESARYGTSEKADEHGDLPVLRMGNITTRGRIDLSDLKYLPRESLNDRYLVYPGDVLFNRTNSPDLVGKTAVYRSGEPLAYAGYLIRVRMRAENHPEYLSAFLNSRYGKAILRNMCKSIIGMANINAQELKRIPIPVPPVDLQRDFARRVEEVEQVRTLQEKDLAYLDELFNALQTRAFVGHLWQN